METSEKTVITVQTKINAPLQQVWKHWISPEDIVKWNQASDDWHSPRAENDPRTGGKFNVRMEAKDGSMGFDLAGVYSNVVEHKLIEYTIGDRKVSVAFALDGNETSIVEKFEAENENSHELQRNGWQAILDSFKRYTESKK